MFILNTAKVRSHLSSHQGRLTMARKRARLDRSVRSSILTLGVAAVAWVSIACSETSDSGSPSTGSTLGAGPTGGATTVAPATNAPTGAPSPGNTMLGSPTQSAPVAGPTVSAMPTATEPVVPSAPAGGGPGLSAMGGAGGMMVGPEMTGPTAGGAGGSITGVGGGGAAGGGAAGAEAAGGTSSGGAGGGNAGGAPSTCDASPGMALQLAEGVVDQMTGNLGSDGPSGDGPRTLELWAKFTGANSWTAEQTIIEMGRRNGAGDMVWGIDMSGRDGNGGRFGPYTNGVTDNNGSSGPLYQAAPDVGWLHLAWAYEGNGGEMVFTVNGEKLPIQDPGSNYTLNLTPGIVTLGASQNFGATGWNGIMDEVRIWNVYRSPEEIAETMNVFLTGDEEGLVAYYNFDDSDGSFVDDVKGTPGHRLEPCTAGNDDRCTAVNDAMPVIVASDIPGPFTCAP